ncbi:ABC transporter permease [Kosmotoga sp.]|uniref:ABC transporter permease n=1 Tax=Kosmotoga sp. TaxID=1955248 RepID=UPI0024AA2236|nr:peptide/nickel transport system permease protein [Kosmotoga sp.]MDK2952941.1 peptide/nickel transport system permease protein [Kosmotoga sp.]
MKKQKAVIKTEDVKKDDLFEVEYMNRWQLAWRVLRRHKLGMISLWILIIMYLVAIFADFLSPHDPYEQWQGLSYSPPSNIHWKDEDGKFTRPYVYPYVLERDPVTYKTTFAEGSSLQSITAIDESTGEKKVFTIGNDDVRSIYLVVETIRYAEDAEGKKAILGNPDYKTLEIVKLSEIGMLKEPLFQENTSEDVLNALAPNKYRTLRNIGDPVKVVTEKRLHRIYAVKKDEVRDVVTEAISLVNEIIDVEGGDFELGKELLAELDIDPELFDVVVTPKVVDFEMRKFPLKFFVRSWEYKLLWLIPMDIHLIGVDDPARIYFFGGDKFGRDVFSRILFGSRISMSIGLLAIMITFTLGLFIGGVAGYYGGWVDESLMRMTEILMSIPGFYLLISLRAILPTNLPSHITYLLIVVILSFLGWPGMSRVIRGMVLSLKEREFVQAAIAMGYPSSRIIWKHIIPNTATYIIVSATLSIPGYILGEAGLSFLGLGIMEPSASWGLMLSQAQNIKVMTEAPWLLVPGIFIFIVVMAFNLLGDALRDALDPRSLGY